MDKNRITALVLAGLMVLGLVACSPADPEPTDTSTPEVTEPADTSLPEEAEPQETQTEQEEQEPQETAATTEVEEEPSPEVAEETPAPPTYSFSEVSETVYATATVNVRSGFNTSADKVGSLGRGQSVVRVGVGTGDAEGWSQVEFNGQTAYISSDYLSLTKPAAQSSGNNSGSQTSQGSSGGQTSQSKPSTQQPSQPSSQPSGSVETTQSTGGYPSGFNPAAGNTGRPTDFADRNHSPDLSDKDWDNFIDAVGDAVSD